jgi:hypothetical protein
MLKMGKSFGLILIIGAFLAACTSLPNASPTPVPPQGDNPYAPQPGDAVLMQSNAEIVSAAVMTAESFPPQISLSLSYRLITPCNSLRVNISQPDSTKRVHLDVYGVAPKDKPCTLMALATPQQATINLGSYPTGQYTVWINGVQIGEFNAQ